jgi:DNA-binding response OmpR family regulator
MEHENLESHPAVEQAAPQRQAIFPSAAQEGLLILCVSEDVRVARRELIPILKRAGFQVELVEANLQKPIDPFSKPYGLIVLDINLPDGPAYQICERSRNRWNLPVMLVLHGAARHDVLRGFQAGADAYILAPFDDREFLARMSALLRRRPARWEVA